MEPDEREHEWRSAVERRSLTALLRERSAATLVTVLRLWAVVLIATLVGVIAATGLT